MFLQLLRDLQLRHNLQKKKDKPKFKFGQQVRSPDSNLEAFHYPPLVREPPQVPPQDETVCGGSSLVLQDAEVITTAGLNLNDCEGEV